MKEYRAVIKEEEGWWIGWLIDLPGVNAQEKTHEELLESLKIGAEDMLALEPDIPPDARLETIEL
ncbi:MAG: type II toxin-antitoxin system HicB family antitoxin [Candidatus Marinimicrobia bacterium]|nr:type II toxin-antitoxin system HicB family antitoxin [Candidatus Neomarinimicrobiota bacterium]